MVRPKYSDYFFSLDANTNRYLRPLVRKGAKNDMKINNEYVLHDRIFAPSIAEQKRITYFFSILDNKINELKEKKTLLEEYKKGMIQKIFSQEIRFKDVDGKEFPKWQEKTLGQLGKTFNGLTGKTKEDFGEGLPYIQYKQIFGSSLIDISECDFVKILNNEKQNKVKFGDIFFTTSSETPLEIGFSSVLLTNVEEIYLNSFCFGYRINSTKILSPFFAQYLFRSPKFRREVIKLGQGSTRYNMSKNELMKTIIFLPTEKEQLKIANFLTKVDEKIKNVGEQIEETKAYKKGLLQKMFCV